MSQQQTNFDPDHQDESPLYDTGYQDTAHDTGYSSHISEEKLFRRDSMMQPTAGQRLALAIVSLVILFLFFLAIIIMLTTGALAPSVAQSFAPAFGYIGFSLCLAVILVNVIFNRKH